MPIFPQRWMAIVADSKWCQVEIVVGPCASDVSDTLRAHEDLPHLIFMTTRLAITAIYNFMPPSIFATLIDCLMDKSSIISSLPPGMA